MGYDKSKGFFCGEVNIFPDAPQYVRLALLSGVLWLLKEGTGHA